VPLDVRDHLFVAPQMPAWIPMIRIRQITAKYRPLAPVYELPYPVRTTEHASIRVHSRDDHLFDKALLEKREQLGPVIRDSVGRGDFDGRDLSRPRVRRSAVGTRLTGLTRAWGISGQCGG
jgi:hypothetical protein